MDKVKLMYINLSMNSSSNRFCFQLTQYLWKYFLLENLDQERVNLYLSGG